MGNHIDIAIEVKNLNHNFKDRIICDNMNINFEKNKIYGLLGKNGVGKSTLIINIRQKIYSKFIHIFIKIMIMIYKINYVKYLGLIKSQYIRSFQEV